MASLLPAYRTGRRRTLELHNIKHHLPPKRIALPIFNNQEMTNLRIGTLFDTYFLQYCKKQKIKNNGK